MSDSALASNVVRLTTAARRKVRQPPPQVRRSMAETLDQHPAEFLYPFVREMKRKREDAQGSAAETMKDSAGLLIAWSFLAVAEPALRERVYGMIFGFNDVFRTPETQKALLLVERLLAKSKPSGCA